jgi:hypothetical protein
MLGFKPPASRVTRRGLCFGAFVKGDKLTDKLITRFDVFQMIKRRRRRPPSPIPPVVIPSARLGSPPTCRTAARSSTARPSRTTNRPEQPSFTIVPGRNCRWKTSKNQNLGVTLMRMLASGVGGHPRRGQRHEKFGHGVRLQTLTPTRWRHQSRTLTYEQLKIQGLVERIDGDRAAPCSYIRLANSPVQPV